MYNYIPEEKNNLRTLSDAGGGYNAYDIFAFDFILRVFQHRGDTVRINYRDGVFITDENYRTHQSNVCWSESNNCYIITKDSKYNESIDDHLFIDELDHLNNKTAIDERMAYIKRREEERRKRDEERRKRDVELRQRAASNENGGVVAQPEVSSEEPMFDFLDIFRGGIPSSYLRTALRGTRRSAVAEPINQEEISTEQETEPLPHHHQNRIGVDNTVSLVYDDYRRTVLEYLGEDTQSNSQQINY
jgi:hypothetical protein